MGLPGASWIPWKRSAPKKSPPPPRSTEQTRARLSLVLLVYFIAIVAVITLAPFNFFVPNVVHIEQFGTWQQSTSMALLFVPLGFLYPLTLQGREASTLRVALLGASLGGVLVFAQLFEHQQFPSVAEAVASAVGAAAGALLLNAVNRRLQNSTTLANRLSLEIPLVALIYLLIPLVVTASLSASGDKLRMISLLPLTLLGARLIAAVQEHHFGPGGVFRKPSIAVVAAGWTALGVFPVILRAPAIGCGFVVLVALAAAFESSIPWVRGRGSEERRFEPAVLRSAVPYIAVYFAVVIFLPLSQGLTDWRFTTGIVLPTENAALQIVRLLEPIAALATLGYVLAEARGRREMPFGKTAMRIAAECALVALTMEASRGFQREGGASAMQFALMVGASLLGAGIYHHQRQRVRWILIHEDASARRTYKSHTLVNPRALVVPYVEPPRDADRSRLMLPGA
jgi:glycopeptide antibiotics resistance protein